MGSVLVDNGNGADSDADGDALLLNAVNGEPAAVSSEITLPSGALLKLDADGGFKYDPNDAFDFLGEGETDTDSFTYRIGDLAGGTDTATATIVITGVNDDDPPGEINGDDGDNVFNIENFDMMQTVDGMGGDDSVILPGNLDDFEIEPIDGGFRFTPKGGGEPIDLLSIEIINLDDATLFLDTTAEIRTVSLVYEVFFDRMGDFDGLAFWKDILSSGFTIEEVIDFFPDSIEFNETFGGDLDNKEFVEVLYQNAFGRGGDEEGCEFWAGLLDDGVLDRGDVGLLFAISEEMQQTFANAIDDGVLISA